MSPRSTTIMQKRTKLKRVPLGQAIEWSDEDLERLSAITPADIENAKLLVKQSSPLLGKLLDSRAVEE